MTARRDGKPGPEATRSGKAMSNYNRTVAPGMEADLRAGMLGQHAAWDFHGEVWFDPAEGAFKEEVKVYGVARGVLSAPTLEELMAKVNDVYGWA